MNRAVSSRCWPRRIFFTALDRLSYGGKSEWGRNLEAARMVGAELEKAVTKLQEEPNAELVVGLFPSNQKGSGVLIS